MVAEEKHLGQGEQLHFCQILKGVLNFVHAPLAHIFNKCYKKVVFRKNNCISVYRKYELKWGLNCFYTLKGS